MTDRSEGKRETWNSVECSRLEKVFIPILINAEESDRRLEIVRSVKTVGDVAIFHSPRVRIPSGNRSLHGFVNSSHSPELHHLRLNPICEDFTCATISSLPSHALDVQRRICKSDLIPRRLPRRIFGHDFTVWRGTATDGRPDTHSEPDARFCVGQPTADGEGAALASTCQLRTV